VAELLRPLKHKITKEFYWTQFNQWSIPPRTLSHFIQIISPRWYERIRSHFVLPTNHPAGM